MKNYCWRRKCAKVALKSSFYSKIISTTFEFLMHINLRTCNYESSFFFFLNVGNVPRTFSRALFHSATLVLALALRKGWLCYVESSESERLTKTGNNQGHRALTGVVSSVCFLEWHNQSEVNCSANNKAKLGKRMLFKEPTNEWIVIFAEMCGIKSMLFKETQMIMI